MTDWKHTGLVKTSIQLWVYWLLLCSNIIDYVPILLQLSKKMLLTLVCLYKDVNMSHSFYVKVPIENLNLNSRFCVKICSSELKYKILSLNFGFFLRNNLCYLLITRKPNIPQRPIVCSIDSPCSILSKYVINIISPIFW